MDEHADALTLKNGSPSASTSVFAPLRIVSVLVSLPMAQIAMHLTAGSSTCFDSFVGPDLRRFFSKESKQAYASGRPMPPIAAAMTSLTCELSSLRSYAPRVFVIDSEIGLRLLATDSADMVCSLKRSRTFSIVRVGSSARPV